MGVPVTFVNHYNPDQFEIIGLDAFMPDIKKGRMYVNGKRKFARILIRRRNTKETESKVN